MIHRHLEIQPGTPVEELPSAAIVDLLERGDLEDWRPVAAAIARDPDGELADRVSHLIGAHPIYGTSPLWRAWIERCRLRAESRSGNRREIGLPSLRHDAGLTQVELAARIGISQSDLSKLERRKNVRLSTLRAYVHAIGGRLRVLAERNGVEVEIQIPGDLD